MNSVQKGRFAESVVAQYLVSKGYSLLQKNWTCHWGELDLIALDRFCLVFVEVKYRSTSFLGSPEEALTRAKINHLYRSIHIFLLKNPEVASKWRFDVVCLQRVRNGQMKLRHYKSVGLS